MRNLNGQRLVLFEVCSDKDKELLESINKSKYSVKIQAGAYFTDKRICEFTDNIGQYNISDRNRRYSELTAYYWAWKNIKPDYIGFEHYRRKYIISDEMLDNLMNEGIGVINIVPISIEPNIENHYRTWHYGNDIDVTLKVIHEMSPEYYNTAIKFFNSDYIYPYCMGIYKYEYFDNLCNWLFPILDRLNTELCEKKCKYQHREIGFIGERLISLFYIFNMEKVISTQVRCLELISDDNKIVLNTNQNFKDYFEECVKNNDIQYIISILNQFRNLDRKNFPEFYICKNIMNTYEFEKEILPATFLEKIEFQTYDELKKIFYGFKEIIVKLNMDDETDKQLFINEVKKNKWSARAIYKITLLDNEKDEIRLNIIATVLAENEMYDDALQILLLYEKTGLATEMTMNNIEILKSV